ncbi:MAG TPA: ABC transporter [Lachnospiraceae bacterium]|uniref:ABC transporter permease n=1 Tax=Anaerosporobacter sp. TaxID=1872529 RepID=UPI000ED4CAFE|nr:ABC transporter permease [Anaerosporobacter sp.]HAB59218.1 ABC transporter [Lachnospiraceae bacterium]
MKNHITNFFKYDFLLSELVKKDIKLKYRRSILGLFWTLLEPLLTMLVLTVVFSKLRSKGDEYFPLYILTGRLIYSFFANSTKAAMKAIRTNSGMIKKVYIPKYIYPLSNVISNFLIFLLSLPVVVLVAIVLKVPVTWHVIEGIIPLVLLFIMSLGVGMILSAMAVFFRDIEYLWSVVLMLIMYCSAIFYEPESVIKNGYAWVFSLNPLYAIITNFRNSIIYGTSMDMNALIYSTVFSFGSLIIGVWFFYKKQDKFILNI